MPLLWSLCTHTVSSIPNVVVSLTIHDNTKMFIGDVCEKNMKPLWKVVQIVRYTWVLLAKDKSNHSAADSLRSLLRRAGVVQLYQVKRMIGGIGNMFVSV